MNPITEIETVYTCLMNFKQIASHLKQSVLSVLCDEGVYHLVIKIQLEHPEIFNDIFPMLGRSAFEICPRQVYLDKEVRLVDRITKMVLNPIDYLRSEKLDES